MVEAAITSWLLGDFMKMVKGDRGGRLSKSAARKAGLAAGMKAKKGDRGGRYGSTGFASRFGKGDRGGRYGTTKFSTRFGKGDRGGKKGRLPPRNKNGRFRRRKGKKKRKR